MSAKVFIIVWGLTEHRGYQVQMIFKQYLLTTKLLMTEKWFTAQYFSWVGSAKGQEKLYKAQSGISYANSHTPVKQPVAECTGWSQTFIRKMLSIFSAETVPLSVLPLADIPLHNDSHHVSAVMDHSPDLTSGLSQSFCTHWASGVCPIIRSVPLTLPSQHLDAPHPRLPKCLNYGKEIAA